MITTKIKGKQCDAPNAEVLRDMLEQAVQILCIFQILKAAGFLGIYIAGCAVGQALTR